MNKEEDETKKPEQPTPKPVAKKQEAIQVTSDVSVSFSLGWGISAGEIRDLPADEESQQIILSNHNIKLIK